MRTAFWAVFLVVALQGIASASAAFASPLDENVSVVAAADLPSAATPVGPDASGVQAPSPTEAKREPAQTPPQVLSKNFQRPRPMQIYWFFGGR